VADLAERLERLGCMLTPIASNRRHFFTFRHPGLDNEALLAGLEEAGVVASLRRDRVRVAPHLYNTHEEMRRLAEAVSALLTANAG
jgi:selenocysteine lyase/cysteine desulfurase